MAGKEDKKAIPLTEELLLKKEADLKTKSEELADEREIFEKSKSEFESEKAVFTTEKSDFEVEKENFAKSKSDFDKSINEKFEELEARENALKSPSEDIPDVEEPLDFEFEDLKGTFHPDAPQNILFNGKSLTQKEIIADKEILLQLIGSKSDLIILNTN